MGLDKDRDGFIKQRSDELFRFWLGRTCLSGAVIFVLLGIQDYVSTPENFGRFFYIRILIAMALVAISLAQERFKDSDMRFHKGLGLLAIVASAAAIELMIMQFGGHRSSYYVGQILLAVVVTGFIPAAFPMHLAFAVSIYSIYLLPILALDTITDTRTFISGNIFLLSVIISSLFLRHLSWWGLIEELGLRYDVSHELEKLKETEQALRLSQSGLARAQQMAQVGDWEWEIASGRVRWSDELYRIYGFRPREISPDYDLVTSSMHPDSREDFLKATDAALKGLHPFEMDYAFYRKDGSVAVLHTAGEVVRDEEGRPVRMIGVVQDITRQRQTEDKIRQSEQFIRNMLDTVDQGFIVVDRDFSISAANRAYCMQTGISSGEIIGKHCYEISHRLQRPCHEEGEECAVHRVFQTGRPQSALHKHPTAEGSMLYVETKAFPVKDENGAVTSVIETIVNITEKYLLEEERLKTQKLEAVGTLAGGIAHDFNNLLQGIFGYISIAKMSIDDKTQTIAMLEQAERALHMSVNLTTQLLTFSKGGKPAKRRLSLRPLIENSSRFALSGSNVDCRFDIASDLWAIEADEGQLGQVIQNIALNADQAMPFAGTISISAKNVISPGGGLPQMPKDGKYVVISIKDSGVGIPQENLQKIFDPYFTTKDKGTGLGLATSYSIVRNHGGLITVTSDPEKGSTFNIYLPALEEEPTPDTSRPVLPSERKGRILVMDDDELVRDIAIALVRVLGHDIEIAEHGESAVSKYVAAKEAGRPFDIVILDLTVRGGMGGRETIERLLAIDPEVRAVVSSGYSDDAVLSEYHNYGFRASLSKPYQLEDLRDTIDSILAS